MFDRIFGSEDLDKKIEELENHLDKKEKELSELKKELENSKKRLKKETKRAKEAITEKQSVDRELKKANQKIKTLKDKLSKLDKDKIKKKNFKNVLDLSLQETLDFLNELKSFRTENNNLKIQYFSEPRNAKLEIINQFVGNIDSETGYVAFWDEVGLIRCILVPPFPLEEDFFEDNKFHFEKLEELLKSDIKVVFASLHAGKSGVGFMEGPEIKEFKVIRSQVKSKHSKGGFSQARFERNRKKQIQEHKEKVLDFLENLDKNNLDYMVLNGNRKIIADLQGEVSLKCPRIMKNLDVSEASKKNSGKFAEEIWSSRIYVL